MKLNLKERLVIQNVLPTEGGFTTMVIKSDLLEKLKITQQEIKDLEVESKNDLIKWNVEKDLEKEFDITDLELNLIKTALNNLDKTEKLNDNTFLLYKKFK